MRGTRDIRMIIQPNRVPGPIVALVISLFLCLSTRAEIYEGTWNYLGNFAIGPVAVAGGDRFVFDLNYEVQFRVDVTPFQSIRFESVTVMATPGVYALPGFGGDVAITLDSYTASFSSPNIDLNPAADGKFELPESTELLGTANFAGQWDNYSLHTDVTGSAAARFGQRFQDMFILPANYPASIILQLEDYYEWKGSNVTPSGGPALAASDVFGLTLEPELQLERFEMPSHLACCNGGYIDIVLTRVTTQLPGDANGDGAVDGTDFGIWNSHKFMNVSGGISDADFNEDGSVDGTDFGIWNANKFTSLGATTVPEPALILPLLWLLGGLSLALRIGQR